MTRNASTFSISSGVTIHGPTDDDAVKAAVDRSVSGFGKIDVLFNAAAALMVADKADDLRQGVEIATESIDSGKAKAKLSALVSITNEGGTAV